MTKKNYTLIAKAIKRNTAPIDKQFDDLSIVGGCLIDDLCQDFKEDNPSFDEKRFKKACGVKE